MTTTTTFEQLRQAVRERRPILLLGKPGMGKTMIARRLNNLMPPETPQERSHRLRIYCLAELWCPWFDQQPPVGRPFRAPHHTVSALGLCGEGRGGRRDISESSLATGGVLFLDEADEFRQSTLELAIHAPATFALVLTSSHEAWARACTRSSQLRNWTATALVVDLDRLSRDEVAELCAQIEANHDEV